MTKTKIPSFALNSQKSKSSDLINFLSPFKEHTQRGTKFLEVAASFDTESTSYYEEISTGKIIDVKTAKTLPRKTLDKEYRKGAYAYAWIFTLNGHCFVGRDIEEFVKRFEGHGYGDLKKEVAADVGNFLTDLQERYNEILHSDLMVQTLREGKEKAEPVAKATLERVQRKIGVEIF